MLLHTLPADLDLDDQVVLLRLDLNIPLKNTVSDLTSNWRLQATVPGIKNLVARGAKVVIISHLGEPNGVDQSLSLKPVATALGELVQQDIAWLSYDPTSNHAALVSAVTAMEPGTISCLENLRFNPGETNNDPAFAQALASIADIFINDAFGVCHRAHASVVSLPKLLPSYAGPLLTKEVEVLNNLIQQPPRPFVAVLGGSKLSTKLPTLHQLLAICDQVLLAGGMANAVLAARGLNLGLSSPSADELAAAQNITNHPKLVLPIDLVVSGPDQQPKLVAVDGVKSDQHAYDIGPATLELFASVLATAKSVVWNGPLGKFETMPFDTGTKQLARLLNQLGQQGCQVVAGGGETLAAIDQVGLDQNYYAHCSTGGGAMLALLAGEKLPGVEALI